MRIHYYLSAGKLLRLSSDAWRCYGIGTPFVVLKRLVCYAFALILRSSKTFCVGGRTYNYALHLENGVFHNERTIEIPIALETFPLVGNVLEIGNVLGQYSRFAHTVVDKYEIDCGVVNEDIETYGADQRFDLILSISTLEHVGWDEKPRDPPKVLRALDNMKSILKPGGALLITVPIGWNSFLDKALADGTCGFTEVHYLRRVNRQNDWIEATSDDALSCGYGSRFPGVNSIAVGIFRKQPGNSRQGAL